MVTPDRQETAVIGGGIIGLATARELLLARPGSRVTVIEKEPSVGQHQSGHNSGVLHAGLTYRPGSLKARLAVTGLRRMVEFCREHGIRFEQCGKLVVATTDEDIGRLRLLLERGTANGLQGLTWVDGDRLAEIEPHVVGRAAVHVPEEGIVDYGQVCRALAGEVERLGGRLLTSAEVVRLLWSGGEWTIVSRAGTLVAQRLVNCAGLQSDRVARLAGESPALRIIPFRGDYYTLRAERRYLIRHLVYPVPHPAFPFLGVHFTRRIDGRVDAGPNAVLALDRESYRRGGVRRRDAAASLGYPGLWRFVARHPGMCWTELRRSCSRASFAAALRRLVPDLAEDDLEAGGCGVRAQAMRPDGVLEDDFAIVERPGAVHVLNAPSPGATASLAIGQAIAERSLAA
jgi:L-2-hydroxyglutarate oxidase